MGILIAFLLLISVSRADQQYDKPDLRLQNTQVSLSLTLEQLTPELVATVVKIGLALRQRLDAEVDLLKAIETRCGRANAVGPYLAHFVAVNENIEEVRSGEFILKKAAEVVFPACLPIYDVPVSIKVPVSRHSGPAFGQAQTIIESDAIIVHQPDKSVLNTVKSGHEYARRHGLEGLLPTTEQAYRVVPLLASGRLKDPNFAEALQPWLDTGLRAVNILSHSDAEDASTADVIHTVSQEIKSGPIGQWQKARAVTAAQDVLLANPESKLTNLQNNARFESVAISKKLVASFNLPAGVPPSMIAKEIDPNVNMDVMDDLEPIFAFPQGGAACVPPTSEATDGAGWPVPVSQLIRILELNAAVYKNNLQGFEREKYGKILVFDTGFPPEIMEHETFSIQEFALNRQAMRLAEHDWTIYSKFIRVIDLIGTDPTSGIAKIGATPFDPRAEQVGHGIAVVTLAFGGMDFLEKLKPEDRVRLLNSETGRVIVVRGYAFNNYNQFTATPADIRKVTEKEGWRDTEPDVINLSLKYLSSEGTNIINSFDQQKNVIFVLAAGNRNEHENEGRDIGDYPVMPAIFGGQRSSNVITVGAHDADGNPGSVSNYSDVHVDLAAPGCDVPVFYWDHQNQKLIKTMKSGTSMATPLVSFTVGILRSNGLEPFENKRRILGSADYRPSWRGKSSTSGILNIPKAVATHFDVIETTSGELLFGNLDWHPTGGEIICGRNFLRDALLKLTVTSHENDNVSIRIMRQNHLLPVVSNFWQQECVLRKQSNELSSLRTFKEASLVDGKIQWSHRSMQISEIRDITFCASKYCLQPSTTVQE